MKLRLSELISFLAWAATLLSAWMIFSRSVPNDSLSWTIFVFYLIVAILASAMTMERKK